MPVKIKGRIYYRTSEACREAGISRATFHRWLNKGIIAGNTMRDRNGWRLLTNKDIEKIKSEVNRTIQSNNQETGKVSGTS